MGKRFCDTEIYSQDWFAQLKPDYKLIWDYLTKRCDNAGIWKVNTYIAGRDIGFPSSYQIDLNDFATACNADGKRRIIFFAGGKALFITTTIGFQVGKTLNEDCVPHKGILNLIRAYPEGIEWLDDQVLQGLLTLVKGSKGLERVTKGKPTLKDKDKDKDKEQDKELIKNGVPEIPADEILELQEDPPEQAPPLNPVKGTGLPFKLRELFLEKGPDGYQWGEADSQASAALIKKIRGMIVDTENKDGTHIPGTTNDQKVLDFFSVLLEKLPDFYREKLFSVPAIEKHFNQIVNEIKTAKSGKRNSGPDTEYRRKLAERLAKTSPVGG